jgi:hypothetical protein
MMRDIGIIHAGCMTCLQCVGKLLRIHGSHTIREHA